MIFICQSTKPIHPNTMFGATGADFIFYKPIANGVLYVLKFKATNDKQHSTVNKLINQLDQTLMTMNSTSATSFVSINDDDALPGSKVLSFDGEGRKSNPLYRQLFNEKGVMLPGVKVYEKEISQDTQPETSVVEDLNTSCVSQSRNVLPTEIQASKKHPMLVEQLFYPELLTQIEEWDMIETRLKVNHGEDEFEPACTGAVYFAITPILPGIFKIGGTKYDGVTRAKQLYTAGVPEKYSCLFEIKCADWKLYEGVVHETQKVNRLYKRKEFFMMSHEEAKKLVEQINGTIPRSEIEETEWKAAMVKVSARLGKSRAKWAAKRHRGNDTSPVSINDNDTLPGSNELNFVHDEHKSSPRYRQMFDTNDFMLPDVDTSANEKLGVLKRQCEILTQERDRALEQCITIQDKKVEADATQTIQNTVSVSIICEGGDGESDGRDDSCDSDKIFELRMAYIQLQTRFHKREAEWYRKSAEWHRKSRAKIDADKSTLMIANDALSKAFVNFSAREKLLKETKLALDQEKLKSAENTQAYNAALEEKDRTLQRLREIFN
jgi:hypothetical protein